MKYCPIDRTRRLFEVLNMAESFVVSFFVDESPDKEMNTYIGSRFIPYIYELMQEHKNIIFLLPYGYDSSESVARTVRVIAKSHSDVKVQCREISGYSIEGLHKKMVDISDLSIFYIEKDNCRQSNILNYIKETDKKYIKMK